MIDPLWELYGKYFPTCNRRNWGVFVKILRGEGYSCLTEEQIQEAIEGTHQDNLYKRLDDPWARFLDRVLKIPKYAP